jgi:hypothetical protein
MTKLFSMCQALLVLFFCAAIPAGAQAPVAGEAAPSGFGNFSPKIFGVPAQDPIVGGAAPLGLASASPAISVVDAQYPVDGGAAAYVPFSADALEQLVRPIALYPDPLLAEIFAAATIPAQIVLADRYVNSGGDLSQIAEQPWDPSVQALAHYPTVLKWLDDNLPWTTEVGDAFLYQQQDVMACIQRLRLLAQSEGNLPSTPQENVVTDNGTVEIEPANPDVIYVPVYPWNTIYYDAGVFCSFGVGFPIGLWLTHDWDWRNHRLIVWGLGHPRPANWWTEAPRNRVPPRNSTFWRGPVRTPAAGAGAADRGFAAETIRATRLTAPPAPAPLADRPGVAPDSSRGIRIGATSPTWENLSRGMTAPAAISRPAPDVRASSAGSSFGSGAFGGSESSSEARQSSMRGVESRSTISAPSSAPSFAQPSRSYEPPASSGSSSHSYEPPASSGSSGKR